MHLVFIRHGQSENNALRYSDDALRRHTGDPELTLTGEMQARAVAEWFAGDGPGEPPPLVPTCLYSSLMLRAVATGAVIAGALGLPLVGWSDLHEVGGAVRVDRDTGELVGEPGESVTSLRRRYPALVVREGVGNGSWWDRDPESLEERRQRAERVVEELIVRHGEARGAGGGAEQCVVVVTHVAFYNLMLRRILGVSPEWPFWFHLNNTGVTWISLPPDPVEERRVLWHNRTAHLPGELIT